MRILLRNYKGNLLWMVCFYCSIWNIDSTLVPTSVNINKLFVFEREIGSGIYYVRKPNWNIGNFSTVQLAFERNFTAHHLNELNTQDEELHEKGHVAHGHDQKHYAIKCINIYELTEYDRQSLKVFAFLSIVILRKRLEVWFDWEVIRTSSSSTASTRTAPNIILLWYISPISL